MNRQTMRKLKESDTVKSTKRIEVPPLIKDALLSVNKTEGGKLAIVLREIAEDKDLVRAAHAAIQNVLVDFRDNYISLLGRGNGLCIRSRDGKPSSIIRMGPDDAVRVGLRAIADHLEGGK